MNLYVGNLSPETTEQQLRDLFSEFGTVKSVKIIIDPQTGFPKGFGFVEMDDKFSAYEAIDNLDVTYFLGGIISVKEAKGNKTSGHKGGGNRSFQKRPGGNSYNRSGGYNRYGDGNRSFGEQGSRPYGERRNYNTND